MGDSSILLFHLVSAMEETMTLFLFGFKHFHGPLPAGPDQWPPQARTGKVSYIRQQILSERDRGAAILLISADLDEVIALSDRIAVMYEGRFVDIVDPRSASIEDIGSMMLGISVRKEEQV
jgi:hypothetical protein